MKVAVAGGTGFIGRHVVRALAAAGHEAVVLSRRPRGDTPHVAVDLARDDVPAGGLDGCEAVVNLVGIKAGAREDFEAVHVGAARRLVEAARTAGIRRFVHVSVVHVPGSRTDYATTKRAGERLVADSGLDFTILRPALVVGPGDDALRNTVRLVHLAPIFVAPWPRPGRHAPLSADDVAEAVTRCLARDVAIGRSYDLVGPQRATMAQLVSQVASALDRPTITLRLPAWMMWPGAALLERFDPDLVTRSQLDLLARGLDGDGAAAADDLDLRPAPLSAATIRAIARESETATSLRVLPTPAHRAAAAAWATAARPLRWFLPLALALMIGMPFLVPGVWVRMAIVETILTGVAFGAIALPWRELWRPRLRPIAIGLAMAGVMYFAGWAVFEAIAAVSPPLAAEAGRVLGWADALEPTYAVPWLVVIAAGEDTVWRAAIALPLAARIGPVSAAMFAGLAFAFAHFTSGPPILWIAAALAGTVWSLLLLRTRSLWSVLTCHAAWDIAVAYVRPYV